VTNRTWLEVERDKARARTDRHLAQLEDTFTDRLERALTNHRVRAELVDGAAQGCPKLLDLGELIIDQGDQLAELGQLIVDERTHADALIEAARKEIPT